MGGREGKRERKCEEEKTREERERGRGQWGGRRWERGSGRSKLRTKGLFPREKGRPVEEMAGKYDSNKRGA